MGIRIVVTPRQRLHIAAKADCSERSVLRVYQGAGNEYTHARVSSAAAELGYALPPQSDRGQQAA
jgi:DNA-binding LacI/PurR family transcriptional regulator